jgi:hypothetical protein
MNDWDWSRLLSSNGTNVSFRFGSEAEARAFLAGRDSFLYDGGAPHLLRCHSAEVHGCWILGIVDATPLPQAPTTDYRPAEMTPEDYYA